MLDASGISKIPTVPEARVDLAVVAELVPAGVRLLDVGCGDGSLLEYLAAVKGIDGRGIELSQKGVNAGVARGLSVIQGDADTDLATYPDGAFDYVVLSQTIQATTHPRRVLEQLLRIGRRAVVSLPNFGHWRIRWQFLLFGRMPVTEDLPYSWYDTPNIHFCTIRDFVELAKEIDADIEKAIALDAWGRKLSFNAPWWFWNLFGEQAVFVLKRKG
ncbi:methionine biosynthesis protein MetW [Siculibacillus lacustris]|uniref:Methionine biosynthesis protein MetW n=1 Tax=Siculibacillus lacustris TaxID=1549641 RepID=A0A4Q9VUU2_9HYPH|nr:methionine biosynthesis protein MetW [Siculibacillus lacustris]TBW39956.1 methionine biosynthesis protein MetW [Siculibacillus lacustris]